MNNLPKLELTPEDLAKVARARERHEPPVKVDDSWIFIAEFGKYYGWDGVQAIRNNEIDIEEALTLLYAARKVWSSSLYDLTASNFIGSISASSKKPKVTFDKLTKDLIKKSKADV